MTDYRVTNGLTTLYTSNSPDLAIAKAKRLRASFPGLKVEAVEIIETRTIIYRPRPVKPASEERKFA